MNVLFASKFSPPIYGYVPYVSVGNLEEKPDGSDMCSLSHFLFLLFTHRLNMLYFSVLFRFGGSSKAPFSGELPDCSFNQRLKPVTVRDVGVSWLQGG